MGKMSANEQFAFSQRDNLATRHRALSNTYIVNIPCHIEDAKYE